MSEVKPVTARPTVEQLEAARECLWGGRAWEAAHESWGAIWNGARELAGPEGYADAQTVAAFFAFVATHMEHALAEVDALRAERDEARAAGRHHSDYGNREQQLRYEAEQRCDAMATRLAALERVAEAARGVFSYVTQDTAGTSTCVVFREQFDAIGEALEALDDRKETENG